ncbi:MAG: nucleotidyl transferase AbiEii/AbiGii toxin family protein [Candidatus Aminicenantes bacterium]|nr:nucleotidyl transferase AbiEii/AbiGii toxin family protein [Candidatus Aminicenantes bacterium]
MLNRNIHKAILLQLLKDIYTDASIGPLIGFKGGTAANLFYDLPRFSVDLDFDLLDEDKETFVFDKVGKIILEYGAIKEKFRKQHTLLFVLSYDQRAQNIKVEINLRTFGSRYELKNYLGIPMLVMLKEDMFAHKLVAMLERTKGATRDVYDVWFFLRNLWPINKEIVERRTKMSFKDYLKKCIAYVESLSDRSILAGMGELLDEKQKAWVREHLKKDTVYLLKIRQQQEE